MHVNILVPLTGLFFQPQMFSVADSHKMTLFQQFFPCCYLISSLTNYSKLFASPIPEVISLSAGGSPPSPLSQTRYRPAAAATEKSTHSFGDLQQGSRPQPILGRSPSTEQGPQRSLCQLHRAAAPPTPSLLLSPRELCTHNGWGRWHPSGQQDIKPSSAASVNESQVSRSLPTQYLWAHWGRHRECGYFIMAHGY